MIYDEQCDMFMGIFRTYHTSVEEPMSSSDMRGGDVDVASLKSEHVITLFWNAFHPTSVAYKMKGCLSSRRVSEL